MKTISSNFKKCVSLLNDHQFHTGNSLGEKLKISRNAIWKMIHQLLQFGITIESSKQHGYRMNQALILLDAKLIKKKIDKTNLKKIEKIHLLASIGSTNDYLKSVFSQHFEKIHICLSEHQSSGKGRLGRTWESPFGSNIYLSLSLKPHKDISQLSGLSLVIGLSVIHALKKHTHQNSFMMKWPNDIFWQDEKIGGILIEIQAESHGNTEVIIGIGLNVNKHPESDRLSLEKILNQYQDRNILTALIIDTVLNSLQQFDEKGLQCFIHEYNHHDYLYKKPIQLKLHQQKFIQGVALGINPLGYLIIQDNQGKIMAYSAGDATLHVDN